MQIFEHDNKEKIPAENLTQKNADPANKFINTISRTD